MNFQEIINYLLPLLEVCGVFFMIGLFTVGGGSAAIPLVQAEAVGRGWITMEKFTSIVAISESTPGPIGINMATYIGYEKFGILGAIITSLAMILPSVIIILIIAKFFSNFNKKPWVKAVFYGLRACIVGLVGVAFITILNTALGVQIVDKTISFQWVSVIIYLIMTFLLFKSKKHPVYFIVLGGILGVIFL